MSLALAKRSYLLYWSISLLRIARKLVAGRRRVDGEKTSSSPCSQRNLPAIAGSNDTYLVVSQRLIRESAISVLSKRNTRFVRGATSSLAFVKSRLTRFRLHENKKVKVITQKTETLNRICKG